MSRIGKKFIHIPQNVHVKIREQTIVVRGPKGTLSRILSPCIFCEINEQTGKIFLTKTINTKYAQDFFGLSRTLVANMVLGVLEGFSKRLKIVGVGYRVHLDNKHLVLNMGYSHIIRMAIPVTLSVKLESPTSLIVLGLEKDIVGEFAAKIRSVRPPEPYKGKGIAYEGEFIRRKLGKTIK